MNKFYLVKHSNGRFQIYLEKDNVLHYKDRNKWQATHLCPSLIAKSTVFYKDNGDITDFLLLTQR